jgi:hypothetical protein
MLLNIKQLTLLRSKGCYKVLHISETLGYPSAN